MPASTPTPAEGAPARPRAFHVLLAEDDDEFRALVARSLREQGVEVTETRNGSELPLGSMLFFGSAQPELDLVVTDVRLPDLSGLDILAGLREADWAMPVILITGFGDDELHAEARRLGALAVFDKPFDVDELRDFIRDVAPTLPRRRRHGNG